MLTYYLATLGLVPYFASRALVPLFTTLLIARIASVIPALASSETTALVMTLPPWATASGSLAVLGLLALAEIVLTKSPEARELMTLSDSQFKAVAAFFLSFNLVEGNFFELLAHVQAVGFTTDYAWGQSFAYTWSFIVGASVWFFAGLRSSIYGFLREVDDDDDLGIQGLLSWLEDSIGFVGVFLVFVLPSAALVAAGIALLCLFLLERYLEHQEESSKVLCEHCSGLVHPCGLRCPTCRHLRQRPNQVGWLGVAREDIAVDIARHRLELVARKRCPSCGDRLRTRKVDQICGNCSTEPFSATVQLDQYLGHLQAELPRTLAILLLLSFVPVLGLIPGILYYRLSLISSLKCYLPRSVGFFLRWIVRLINLFLLCLQPIPLLGALALPAMCLTNYLVYRAALRRQGNNVLNRRLQPSSG